jgi:hypothetical protein
MYKPTAQKTKNRPKGVGAQFHDSCLLVHRRSQDGPAKGSNFLVLSHQTQNHGERATVPLLHRVARNAIQLGLPPLCIAYYVLYAGVRVRTLRAAFDVQARYMFDQHRFTQQDQRGERFC